MAQRKTNVKRIQFNKVTQEQYDLAKANGQLNPTEFYLIAGGGSGGLAEGTSNCIISAEGGVYSYSGCGTIALDTPEFTAANIWLNPGIKALVSYGITESETLNNFNLTTVSISAVMVITPLEADTEYIVFLIAGEDGGGVIFPKSMVVTQEEVPEGFVAWRSPKRNAWFLPQDSDPSEGQVGWTNVKNNFNENFNDIVFMSDTGYFYLGVGDNGKIAKALVSDRSNWTDLANPFGASNINAIACDRDTTPMICVAVGDDGKIATSTNMGTTWALTYNNASSGNIERVIYANGKYIATGDKNVFTSSNGTTWTVNANVFDPDSTDIIRGVSYDGTQYILVGGGETPGEEGVVPHSQIATSTDGVSWAVEEVDIDDILTSLVYGDNLYVAGTAFGNVYNSNDLTGWFKVGSAIRGYINKVIYETYNSGGQLVELYVAITANGKIMYSNNGAEWEKDDSFFGTFNVSDVIRTEQGDGGTDLIVVGSDSSFMYNFGGQYWNKIPIVPALYLKTDKNLKKFIDIETNTPLDLLKRSDIEEILNWFSAPDDGGEYVRQGNKWLDIKGKYDDKKIITNVFPADNVPVNNTLYTLGPRTNLTINRPLSSSEEIIIQWFSGATPTNLILPNLNANEFITDMAIEIPSNTEMELSIYNGVFAMSSGIQ